MRIEQLIWKRGHERRIVHGGDLGSHASIVFAFGGSTLLADPHYYNILRDQYPLASILMCSTAGEIVGTSVYEDSLVATAVKFEHTTLSTAEVCIEHFADSFAAGEALGQALPHDGLIHVFVVSDGQKVNGSELIGGLKKALPQDTIIAGGLAGDGNNFERTYVGIDKPPTQGRIVAVGFYGDRLRIGYGSVGGWDPFGPERLITRAQGNVLYELDGQSALDLYKRYLGDQADHLPGSALLFPLSISQKNGGDHSLVRTVLSVNEQDKSMIFAGNMPTGWYARFMKANFERLIDGAAQAAHNSSLLLGEEPPDLAILISCIGRKNVLAQRVEEEVEGVSDILGASAVITGFYSYGEISPLVSTTSASSCELHNQTMTITAFREV